MADTTINDLAEATSWATGDFIEILDKSDTSMASTGTNKKISAENLFGEIPVTQIAQYAGVSPRYRIYENSSASGAAYIELSHTSATSGHVALSSASTAVLDLRPEGGSSDAAVVRVGRTTNTTSATNGIQVLRANGAGDVSEHTIYGGTSSDGTSAVSGTTILADLCRNGGSMRVGQVANAGSFLRLPRNNDANRPSAAVGAGCVFFNTDDGNLNISDGTNWLLPDGTTT